MFYLLCKLAVRTGFELLLHLICYPSALQRLKEAKQMKSDLEKMDANVAQMYADKCNKSQDELLALMKKGGWLTAQEALEWGFVDEITHYEEDAAPVITDSIAADMASSGIPVPAQLASQVQPTPLLSRFIEALTNLFKSNSNSQSDMNPNNQQQEQQAPEASAQQETTTQESTQQSAEERITALEQAHREALAAKDTVIASLQAQIAELKKAPGDSTSHVVEDEKKENKMSERSSAEDYCDTFNRAKALFDSIG